MTPPAVPSCFDQAPVQLWTARPNGELEYVNRRVADYFGKSPQEILEWGWADLVHPDDLEQVGEAWSTSLETGVPYRVKFRLRRHDGTFLWHLAQAEAIRDDDGAIRQWAGANTLLDELVGAP